MTTYPAPTAPLEIENFETFLDQNHLCTHLAALELGWKVPRLPGSDDVATAALSDWIREHGRVMTGERGGEIVSVFTWPLPGPKENADPSALMIFEGCGAEIFQWTWQDGQLRPAGPIRHPADISSMQAAILDPSRFGLHPLPDAWTDKQIKAVLRDLSLKRWTLSVLLGVLGGGLIAFSFPFPKVVLIMLFFCLMFRFAGRYMTTAEYRMSASNSSGPLRVCQIVALGRSLEKHLSPEHRLVPD